MSELIQAATDKLCKQEKGLSLYSRCQSFFLVSFSAFVKESHNKPLHIAFNRIYLIEKLSVMYSFNPMSKLNSKLESCKQLKEFTKTYKMLQYEGKCTLTLQNYHLQKSKEMSRGLRKHGLWWKISEWTIKKQELISCNPLPRSKRPCQLRT